MTSYRDIDPKKFHRIVRETPTTQTSQVSNFMSLVTEQVEFGLQSKRLEGTSTDSFLYYVNKGAATSTTLNKDKSKTLIVMEGSALVRVGLQTVKVTPGTFLLVEPGDALSIKTTNDSAVIFAVVQDKDYDLTEEVVDSSSVNGTPVAIAHPERYKSKAVEQLSKQRAIDEQRATEQIIKQNQRKELKSQLPNDDSPFNPLDPDSY